MREQTVRAHVENLQLFEHYLLLYDYSLRRLDEATDSEVYFSGAPTSNFAVDISAVIDQKIAALRGHSSQLSDHFDEMRAQVRTSATEAGKKYGMAYAEEFHRAEKR